LRIAAHFLQRPWIGRQMAAIANVIAGWWVANVRPACGILQRRSLRTIAGRLIRCYTAPQVIRSADRPHLTPFANRFAELSVHQADEPHSLYATFRQAMKKYHRPESSYSRQFLH